ncbi:MAG: DUF1189 family protein [Candidatus Pacebacteria bacterium]|nr:DUF1189 family protein [Candidatus Paceibacterota bacterium]
MKKLTTFFRSLVLSCISPSYYNDLAHTAPSFSWKYLVLFQCLSAIISTLAITVAIYTFNINTVYEKLLSFYPQNLEMTFDEKGVSVNKPLPYSIPLPIEFQSSSQFSPKNLIVFDTDEHVKTLEDVRKQNTFVVVTPKHLYTIEKEGEMKVNALPSFDGSFVLRRAMVDSTVDRFMRHPFIQQRWYAPSIGLLLFPFISIVLFFIVLFTALFYAIPVWIFTFLFMKAKNLSYGTIFRLSFHSLTPVVILSTFFEYAKHFQWLPQYMTNPILQGPWFFIFYAVWTIAGLRTITPPEIQKAHAQKKK